MEFAKGQLVVDVEAMIRTGLLNQPATEDSQDSDVRELMKLLYDLREHTPIRLTLSVPGDEKRVTLKLYCSLSKY